VISGSAFSPDGKLLALSERRKMLWLLDGGAPEWHARAAGWQTATSPRGVGTLYTRRALPKDLHGTEKSGPSY